MSSRPMLKVILPDGSSKEFPGSVPVKEVAAAIGPRLLKAAVAAEVDGKIVGLDYKLPAEGEVEGPHLHDEGPRGAGRDAALGGAHHGAGGDAAEEGRAARVRADGRRRLLLRLRDSGAAEGGGFSGDRSGDEADHRPG